MQEQKLGRGLSALLGESKSKKEFISFSNANPGESVELIPLNKIIAGIYQPRQNFNQNELVELADSIKESGLIQPILLRKSEDDHYEIIAGERRFRATKIAGLKTIPAIVKKINNHEALELAIVENIQRSDLSPIEEARGYQRLVDEFSYTQEQIAKRTGKSRSHITNLLRLLGLPENVRDLLDRALISMGHARAIINSIDPVKLARRVIDEELTVRDVEILVRDEKIDKINKNTPLLVRTESKIKFVNSTHLSALEEQLSTALGLQSKISYNSFRNSGKIIIKFNEFEKVQKLIEKLS